MNFRDLIKLLEDDGWYVDRQSGSHKQFRHKYKKGTVTVSCHKLSKDVAIGTLKSIKKQAGLVIGGI